MASARLKTLSLISAMALAPACGAKVTGGGERQGIGVALVPPSAEVVPGGAVAFDAVVTGTTNTSVRWSVQEASGGTIDASGLYTAPSSPATYHVVATSVADPSVTGIAPVTVTATPSIGVAVLPRTGYVQSGGTFRFTATVTGTTAGQSTAVTWSVQEAGGGTIDASGLYTAPPTPGSYHVVATSVADASKSDTAAVTVTGAAAAPAAAPRAGQPALVTFTSGQGASGTTSISGLGRAVVWFDTPSGSGFDLKAQAVNVGWSNGVPTSYVIEASRNGGNSWTALVNAPANSYAGWAHLVDLAGYNRVRLRQTGPTWNGTGPISFAVHDARAGTDDWWLFLGDSNTDVIFRGGFTVPGEDSGRFGYLVNQVAPARWPIAVNGGVSAGVIDHFLRTRDDPWSDTLHDGTGAILYPDGQGNPQPLIRKWMQQFQGKYVSIAIGTNDVNIGFSWRPATSQDLDAMQAKYQLLIGEVLAAGKTVVLPTLRWCTTNQYTAADIAAWNDRLWNVILPMYPSAVRGPDIYAGSVDHPEWLADGTHPNAAGAIATRQDWVNWAMATVY